MPKAQAPACPIFVKTLSYANSALEIFYHSSGMTNTGRSSFLKSFQIGVTIPMRRAFGSRIEAKVYATKASGIVGRSIPKSNCSLQVLTRSSTCLIDFYISFHVLFCPRASLQFGPISFLLVSPPSFCRDWLAEIGGCSSMICDRTRSSTTIRMSSNGPSTDRTLPM